MHRERSEDRLCWQCVRQHQWAAALDGALDGDWCRVCHIERIKPSREAWNRAASERGGKCVSAYVDKATTVKWECAQGHRWTSESFRIRKCQWCHQCAMAARTPTIEQMQALAHERGGLHVSDVSRRGRGSNGNATSGTFGWRQSIAYGVEVGARCVPGEPKQHAFTPYAARLNGGNYRDAPALNEN